MTTFQPVKFKTNDPFVEDPISTERDFNQELFNVLTDLSSLTGFAIGSDGLDKLSAKSKKLVALVDEIVIARAEKLQKAVVEAFNHLEERIKVLETPHATGSTWTTSGVPINADAHNSLGEDENVSDL